MSKGKPRRKTETRFTLSRRDVERCDIVFVAIDISSRNRKQAAEAWCDLNPWSRQIGGVKAMILDPIDAYRSAMKCERNKVTARVVRVTEADAEELASHYQKVGNGE